LKYKDLLSLEPDSTGRLQLSQLYMLEQNTPLDVSEQFYCDHGLNSEFQEQYGDIVLEDIKWSLEQVDYKLISNMSVYDDFRPWVETCRVKSTRVQNTLNWKLIGHTETVCEFWKQNKTWFRSPIVLKQNTKYHLVEGHSRFGCLKGLVSTGLISPLVKHLVWFGTVD